MPYPGTLVSSDGLPLTDHKLPSTIPTHVRANANLLQKAQLLDASDPLRKFRCQFSPSAPLYLCGNSLGQQPLAAATAVDIHLSKWAKLAVRGHFEEPSPWACIEDEPALLSVEVVGAHFSHEVAICNSLTVNLHLMLVAFYRPTATRFRVLVEQHIFPSDLYAIQSHLQSRNIDPDDAIIFVETRPGEDVLRDEDIVSAISNNASSLALVLLPGVQYLTGQVFPLASIARECKKHDVVCGLDVAHAVGNIPLQLHKWNVDFAVWCTYKYLNCGPGALAGLFVHNRHARSDLPRLGGWWGHDPRTRFDMRAPFSPRRGAPGFQLSNPPVLAIVPITASLSLLRDAGGMTAVRAKSERLTAFLDEVLNMELSDGTVSLVTPKEKHRRGAQVSLRLNRQVRGRVRELNERLERLGVVCDVREPDVLRVAPAPLYNGFEDVVWFAAALRQALHDMTEGAT